MKDREYDAIYAGLISGRVDAANKVILLAEELLTSMLEDGKAGKYESDADKVVNLLYALNSEIRNESLWFVSADDE